jgi:hypothetical protein
MNKITDIIYNNTDLHNKIILQNIIQYLQKPKCLLYNILYNETKFSNDIILYYIIPYVYSNKFIIDGELPILNNIKEIDINSNKILLFNLKLFYSCKNFKLHSFDINTITFSFFIRQNNFINPENYISVFIYFFDQSFFYNNENHENILIIDNDNNYKNNYNNNYLFKKKNIKYKCYLKFKYNKLCKNNKLIKFEKLKKLKGTFPKSLDLKIDLINKNIHLSNINF